MRVTIAVYGMTGRYKKHTKNPLAFRKFLMYTDIYYFIWVPKIIVEEGLMPGKYAWVWNIKPEWVEEYVKMHLSPWPEIMKAHSEAGFKNYSIFRNGNQFIYEFECDGDPDAAFTKMIKNPDCIRWNNITSKMIDTPLENGNVSSGVRYLREIFYLK
jgi:L-rhamnose mutarotase